MKILKCKYLEMKQKHRTARDAGYITSLTSMTNSTQKKPDLRLNSVSLK